MYLITNTSYKDYMKKKLRIIIPITIILSIIIIITAILFIYKISNEDVIKKTLNGVVISKETGEVLEHVTVTIHGELDISKDLRIYTFVGEMGFSNIKHTQKVDTLLTYVNSIEDDAWDSQGSMSHFIYYYEDNKFTMGSAWNHMVAMDSNFSYLIIGNYEDNYITYGTENTERVFNGTDLMVFPANDSESAIKIIEEHQVDKEIFKITTKEEYERFFDN